MSAQAPLAPEASLPRNDHERSALARIHGIRQVSGWATVAWFPLILSAVALGYHYSAVGIALAAALFSGLLRLAVAWTHCPRCQERFASHSSGLREIWQNDRCAGCGLQRYAH